ncbi:MAG: hypothetical protein Q4C46_05410 [Bacillota bacterium]|nr:hypothetical protein [Bacillota bacterium]
MGVSDDMKITIRTSKVNFSMPVPLSMAGTAVRAIPEAAFRELRRKVPAPYDSLITKENILIYFNECKDIFARNKGMKIIHIEGHDGTYISVIL